MNVCTCCGALTSGEVTYVKPGGGLEVIAAPFNLGIAAAPPARQYGIRRALWDAAYGHVNGFPPAAILYYVATRSLSLRVWGWAFRREQRNGHHPVYMRMSKEGHFVCGDS